MLLALGVTALCTIVHDGRELPTQQNTPRSMKSYMQCKEMNA